jgi:hypothetical protein
MKGMIATRKTNLLAIWLLPLMLSACQSTDAVAKDSAASFGALLALMQDRISPDESIGGYALEISIGSDRFLWSRDFSSSVYDARLETDIMPFVEAGLDTSKLPEGMVHEGSLILGADFGNQTPGFEGEATPQKAFEQIAKYKRDSIKFYSSEDRYGIDLGDGHMFEWAKSLQTSDKDIVFVINPKPFTDAGADPNKIPGWTFAKAETGDAKGNAVQADRIIKAFHIQ